MKNIKKTLGITAIAALTLGAGAVAIAPNVNNNDISVHNESSVTTENITQFDFEDTPFTINISEQVSTGEFADAGAYDMEIAVEIEHIEGEQAQVMNELNIRTRMYNGTATSTQLIDATTNNTILDMSSDDDLGLENILTETTQLFRYEEMIIRIDGDYTYTDSMDDLHEDVEFDFELNYDNSTMALGVDQANNKMIRKVSPVLDYDYDDQTDLLTLNGEVKLISNSG
ncbi:MAG: hypothetical protein DRP42_01220 [Tenericutes bacterium]|nr:MAG: hypothetical protein DRP42_01220 [Mycoplasmatota bacterium]